MFTELLPILKTRTLVLTVAQLEGNRIRVNVVPHANNLDNALEKAQAVPLSVEGTAEELDQELPGIFSQYTESYEKTRSTLLEAQVLHAAAMKEIADKQKQELDAKRKTAGSGKATTPVTTAKQTTTVPPAKLVFGVKPGETPPPPAAPSLFDTAPIQEGESA